MANEVGAGTCPRCDFQSEHRLPVAGWRPLGAEGADGPGGRNPSEKAHEEECGRGLDNPRGAPHYALLACDLLEQCPKSACEISSELGGPARGHAQSAVL